MNPEPTDEPKPDTSSPYYEGEAAKIEASKAPHLIAQPMIYRKGKDLILLNGASLSSLACIKSGHTVKTVLSVDLRHPLKPKTWFGSAKKVMIGLDKKNLEKFRLAQTVYLAVFWLGVLTLLVGIFSGFTTVCFGLLLMLAGCVGRTLLPIWSPSSSENRLTIRGCGEAYLKHFPEQAES